jgi:hypothetical protein
MAEPGDVLKLSDLVIAACTLIGPVLAVQAQKSSVSAITVWHKTPTNSRVAGAVDLVDVH